MAFILLSSNRDFPLRDDAQPNNTSTSHFTVFSRCHIVTFTRIRSHAPKQERGGKCDRKWSRLVADERQPGISGDP